VTTPASTQCQGIDPRGAKSGDQLVEQFLETVMSEIATPPFMLKA